MTKQSKITAAENTFFCPANHKCRIKMQDSYQLLKMKIVLSIVFCLLQLSQLAMPFPADDMDEDENISPFYDSSNYPHNNRPGTPEQRPNRRPPPIVVDLEGSLSERFPQMPQRRVPSSLRDQLEKIYGYRSTTKSSGDSSYDIADRSDASTANEELNSEMWKYLPTEICDEILKNVPSMDSIESFQKFATMCHSARKRSTDPDFQLKSMASAVPLMTHNGMDNVIDTKKFYATAYVYGLNEAYQEFKEDIGDMKNLPLVAIDLVVEGGDIELLKQTLGKVIKDFPVQDNPKYYYYYALHKAIIYEKADVVQFLITETPYKDYLRGVLPVLSVFQEETNSEKANLQALSAMKILSKLNLKLEMFKMAKTCVFLLRLDALKYFLFESDQFKNNINAHKDILSRIFQKLDRDSPVELKEIQRRVQDIIYQSETPLSPARSKSEPEMPRTPSTPRKLWQRLRGYAD